MEQEILPGTLDALEPIRKYVENAGRSAGLEHQAIYRLCLAVDEIATNIVVHGYEEAGLQGDIKISAAIEADQLVIALEDHGESYDPNFHNLPSASDLDRGLESREVGGLGIFLALDGVDDLQYTTTKDANVHRFIVRREQKRT